MRARGTTTPAAPPGKRTAASDRRSGMVLVMLVAASSAGCEGDQGDPARQVAPAPAQQAEAAARQAEPTEGKGRPGATAEPRRTREPSTRVERQVQLTDYTSATEYPDPFHAAEWSAWKRELPQVERVEIPASADGGTQHALFYDPGSEDDRPLLVVLHSWSSNYLQNIDIPFGVFATENEWIFIHPDFRGPNRRPEATASELAVRDVLDAVEYARRHADVDESRIYLVGYSGGAMMALVMAGKHPDLWAGIVTWVPVFDLPDWYRYHDAHGRKYAPETAASCGGPPRPGSKAHAECSARSPRAHLHEASGRMAVFIGQGIEDHLLPPGHAIRTFNALAAPEDRISDAHREYINAHRELPEELEDRPDDGVDRALFEQLGYPVLLERHSRGAALVLFDGDHDMLYNPGLKWLAGQRRR